MEEEEPEERIVVEEEVGFLSEIFGEEVEEERLGLRGEGLEVVFDAAKG